MTLSIEETKNINEIQHIVDVEDVKLNLMYDTEELTKYMDKVLCYKLMVDEKVVGFGLFAKLNDDGWIVDVGVLPDHRGRDAYNLGKMALIKFFKDIDTKVLLTRIDLKNKRSRFYAASLGFKKLYHENGFIYMHIPRGKLWVE